MSQLTSATPMKNSGIPWIGEIPEHWEVVLLRLVARIESGHTPSRSHPEYWVKEECTIPWFSLADVWQLREGKQKYLTETMEKISNEGIRHSAARILPSGTVVLSRTASVGFSGIMSSPMATTQDFVNWICGPRVLPGFLLWVFRAMKPEFERLMMGSTHQTIYMPDVRQFRSPLPSLPTQRAIADFLDRKTAAIDALIEKKQRLIELLAEKRAALINRAVTKGLNPDVPMKDSGIPWIGEIPAHWEVAQLKRYITLQRGVDITKAEQSEGDIPVISSGGALSTHDTPLTQGPGVVIGRKGSVGTVHYVETDFWPHDTTLWVKNFRDNIPRFVYYKFVDMQLSSFDTGSANPTLNRNLVHPVLVPWPPPIEQMAIVSYLDEFLRTQDDVVERLYVNIGLLDEYRQALITAAVTGQIDVTTEATP